MKKLKPIIVSIILLTIPFILFQCTDQHLECEVCDEDAGLEMEALPPVLVDFSIAGVSLPSGTMVEYVTPRIAQLTYPEGYKWVTVNAEGDHTMSQTGTYSCTCSGEGCDVIAVPKKGGDWDVACSSCTSDCTGRWVDSDVGVNSGFINIDKGITFIQESVECGDSPDPSSFFEIPELHQKINDFATNHKLSLWDGDSDDFVLIPLQAFGTPLMLKFDSNLPSNVLAEVADNNIVILTDKGDGTPSCNCGSGSSGCNFEPIEYDAGWLGKRTVGYRCAAGECETCNMTLPESN